MIELLLMVTISAVGLTASYMKKTDEVINLDETADYLEFLEVN